MKKKAQFVIETKEKFLLNKAEVIFLIRNYNLNKINIKNKIF